MPLVVGQLLQNRYRIEALLGQGGFGAVYRAVDLNINFRVAIKENLDASPEAQRQFAREAALLVQLRHPSLPRVTDAFFIPGWGSYIVMDLIEGQTLQDMLDHSGAVDEARAVAWLSQVLDALAYLHEQTPPIIHRDLKPANIIVTPQGRATLVDFGIAKVYDPSLLTTTGARAVTPGYSPWEQYKMTGTDTRSDVYAAGATLYALLTGQTPPESIDLMGGLAQLIPPRVLKPRLSPQVEAAIQRAMTIQPTGRFANAGQFRAALSAPPRVTPPMTPTVVVRPPTAPGPSTPTSAKVPILIGLAVLGLLALFLAPKLFAPPASPTLAPAIVPTVALASVTPRPELPTHTPPPGPTRAPTAVVPGSTRVSDQDGMTLLYVPAGEFTMGSNDGSDNEKPPHPVYLDAFYIDQTEVTNAMFQKFVDATGYQTDAEKQGSGWAFDPAKKEWSDTPDADWQHPRGSSSNLSGLDNHPVVQVSWNDAQAYCQWAGRDLPTEAQWEKAARGTDERTYPWGNAKVAGNLLNFADRNLEVDWADKTIDDGYQFTAPVGHYPDGASFYGALDMAGNVWEWVRDWYAEKYYDTSPTRNPENITKSDYRAVRGGGWSYVATVVRASNRLRNLPDNRLGNVGFRCAR